MEIYKINSAKRRKALKYVVKENVKTSNSLVKFCYGLTIALRILAFVLGIANILYVLLISDYLVEMFFLIMTFGFPYGISFLPATFYSVSCAVEYRLRRRETITLTNDGFVYSYHDDRVGLLNNTIFGFNVLYEKIRSFDYNTKTSCITLYGSFIVDTYENDELKVSNEYNEFTLLNVFECDVKEIIERRI